MSVADLYDLELIWPSLDPTDVIVTGTFDQWSSSIHLARGGVGFFGTVQVPWGQKVAYKFIVDGRWQCRGDRPQEDDGDGNMNNVLQTPEKPTLAAAPARLTIPLDGVPSEGQSEGHGDAENMVTAVEFFPPPEPAAIKGLLPLPIPQITVDGLGQAPSSMNESKLNTAAATEGNISPTSVTELVEAVPSEQAPTSHDVSTRSLSDSGPDPLPPINGDGAASDGLVSHPPVQFSAGEASVTPSVSHVVEAVVKPSESAVDQSGAQVDKVSPAAVEEPTPKQPEVNPAKAPPAVQGQFKPVPAVLDVATSTPASSTLTQKKRRSFFARIKRIFEKDKDKQERRKKDRL